MNCRHCNTPLTNLFIDLKQQPPSNGFLFPDQLDQPEALYPLKIYICPECFLVQIDECKKCCEIFNEKYVYFSSFSSSWLKHAREYTEMATARFQLDGRSQVVEIASNDGYLLQYMKAKGIPCYGVEPSLATAEAAAEKGIESVTEFYTEALAKRLVRERGPIDLLIGNNVLAHVPDINDFVKGIAAILKDTGVATLEFPHLMRMVNGNQFDTIYVEHYSYLSLSTVKRIFEYGGLRIFDVQEICTHGGSLRIFACPMNADRPVSEAVASMLALEKQQGMDHMAYYEHFQEVAEKVRTDLLDFLRTQKAAGKSIAAYGAAAKGNTLLNYCGISTDFIDFCVDISPHKQGLYMPGSHIPVLAPGALKDHKPDYVMILPWNIQKEILHHHGYIKEWGGTFFTAIPELTVF